MTANRWWVKTLARWIARVNGVQAHMRLAMLALTGVSTATLTLQQYGYGSYAWPMIAALAVAMLAYTYLYTEGGVWNQVSRDSVDLSTNFAGPSMAIDDTLTSVAVFVAIHGRKPSKEELEMIEGAIREPWEEYRDGIDWVEAED